MFSKDINTIKYERDEYSFAENLYNQYIEMRKIAKIFEDKKYDGCDEFILSKDGKEGFIAGVYIMLALSGDM